MNTKLKILYIAILKDKNIILNLIRKGLQTFSYLSYL